MMRGMQTDDWRALTAVEGLPLLGGQGRMRLLEQAPSGLAYLIHYPAGVASPPHAHDHDSIVYVLSGRLRGAVGGVSAELGPGDSILYPKEVKSPLPSRPPVS